MTLLEKINKKYKGQELQSALAAYHFLKAISVKIDNREGK